MENCYFCKEKFNGLDIKKHDEHIIQNSIGGKLTANDILCEKCGGILGKNIDDIFIRNLSPFTALLDLARDRGETTKSKIEISLGENRIEDNEDVTFEIKNDFSIVPSKPICIVDRELKNISIFCSTDKQFKQYKNRPNVRKYLEDNYTIHKYLNIAPYVESANLGIDYESPIVLKGILKIALGFAFKSGVQPELLSHLTNDSNLVDDDDIAKIVWQYYPISDEEKIYEIDKHQHENWYPNHQIYLFNVDRNLYCYIELFGAIQKYVHLSDCYTGENIKEKYIQKTTKWIFNEEDWRPRRIQDWHILAQQFDVPFDMQNGDMEKLILQKARSRSYVIDPDTQIDKVKAIMDHLIMFTVSDLKGHEHFDSLREKASIAESKFKFSLVSKLKKDIFLSMSLISKDYYNFRIKSDDKICPIESRKQSKEDKDKYILFKAFEFLSSLNIEDKIGFKIINTD